MMKLYLTLLSTLLFLGCASNPKPTVSNYLLSSPSPLEKSVQIGSIEVEIAEYLESTNVQLELADGTLRPATYHHWAQSLEVESERYLEKLLEPIGSGRAAQLKVVIQRFHGDEDGVVLLEGKWKIDNKGNDKSDTWSFFSIEKTSSTSGYGALVETHASLLSQLGRMIILDL